MSNQAIADALDKRISSAVTERDKTIAELGALFRKWGDELRPKIDVILKHGLPFKNPKLNLLHFGGILIGQENGLALILRDGSIFRGVSVREIDPEYMPLELFLSDADLETARAGFLYVADIEKTVCQLEDENRLRNDFLRKNKDGLRIPAYGLPDSSGLSKESCWK